MNRTVGACAALVVGAVGLAYALASNESMAAPRGGAPRVRPPRSADAGSSDGGNVHASDQKADGGTMRFGETEIEGRLKNPQLIYFMRRVRGEFAADDLGHRSFFPELSETPKDPNFSP